MKETILIGICTYNRPQMLQECLQSLVAQVIPENVDLIFCVADNNSSKDYKINEVVKKNLNGLNYKYLFVEERGISFARNALIEAAIENNADFIAFIDDDEIADKNWIHNIHKKIKSSEADAVQGIVIHKLPSNIKPVIDGIWDNKGVEDATLTWFPAGNALFKIKLVKEWGLRFSPMLALTGGEDLDFFLRSYQKGGKHVFTNSAIVYETVPKERTYLSWQIKRVIKEGFILHYILYIHHGRKYIIRKYLLKSILSILKNPIYIALRPKGYKKRLRKFFIAIGCLSACLNFKINSYRRVTGY